MSEKLFSEIGKGSEYIDPKHMWVIKAKNRSYNAFWNDSTKTWGGLLEATVFTEEVPLIDNGEVVDYREVIGLK